MSAKKTLALVFGGLLAIVAIVSVATSWYTVDESEQAVVITLGEAGEPIVDSGLHFKMPWPIQKAEILSKETFSLTFGYTESPDGELETVDKDAKMITGDENIVLTDLVVQWKIVDPKKYLFNSEDPRQVLHSATSSAIRSVIGSSKIDAALTDGKAEIEASTRDILVGLIEKYDIGISVLGVKLQDVELPNADVRAAFTAVTDARETKNTKKNEADKYKNQKLSEAEGEKDAIISRAMGEKAARVAEAQGETAIFNQLYNEYAINKAITRERLVIETLEEVLPNANIYIMNDDGNTMKYLPLVPQATQPAQAEGGTKKDEQQ